METEIINTAAQSVPPNWFSIIGPIGATVLLISVLFRNEISGLLNRIGGTPSSVSKALADHISDENNYWKRNDASFIALASRVEQLEINNVEVRVTLERQHEETVRELGRINETMSRLTDRLIEHIDRVR